MMLVDLLTLITLTLASGVVGYTGVYAIDGWMDDPDDPVEWFDPYCNRGFHDRESARTHAIDHHNAPGDGDAWEDTYDRIGRE